MRYRGVISSCKKAGPILVNNRRHRERDWGNGHGLAPVFRVPERKRPTRADHTTISVPCRDGVNEGVCTDRGHLQIIFAAI
ncbi:hypothetical protein BS17DRAFT_346024 [Gyrodon lividus]|nr:hypothetical protein BS17DRAFT_346024 [Gyrodon lividus]